MCCDYNRYTKLVCTKTCAMRGGGEGRELSIALHGDKMIYHYSHTTS